jgi:hypothetical protein
MKPINIEKLRNHSAGISDSYYRATENELLEDYLKAVQMLLIHNDKLTLQKHVEELTEKSREENYIIKGKLSDKENDDTDIALLKDAIYDMQQLLKNPDRLLEIAKNVGQ